MNRCFALLFFVFFVSCSQLGIRKNSGDIALLHYNIKELDTDKINHGLANNQLKSVAEIVRKFKFDILSVNEIQYDLPGVPGPDYQAKGENLSRFGRMLKLPMNVSVEQAELESWQTSFNPSNTGRRARMQKDRTYLLDPDKGREFADPYDFGLFPSQYSIGALFKFKKKQEIVIADLPWKVFNPSIKLKKYKGNDGSSLPNKIALFDKNFSDITLDIDGKDVHLILLHGVPAYHFGNQFSPNYDRNLDQLRFLEWYVTGKTDIPVSIPNLKPLAEDSIYIIVGDLNADYRNLVTPGSEVIRRLMATIGVWMEKPGITNESFVFEDNRLQLTLDYIFFSKQLNLVNGGVYYPPENKELIECDASPAPNFKVPKNKELVYFQMDNKPCYGTVNKAFHQAKLASDHFPIWAIFNFKD